MSVKGKAAVGSSRLSLPLLSLSTHSEDRYLTQIGTITLSPT